MIGSSKEKVRSELDRINGWGCVFFSEINGGLWVSLVSRGLVTWKLYYYLKCFFQNI